MKQTRYLIILLFFAVLITTAISCKRGGTTTHTSAVSHDSAYARFDVAQSFYNSNQHDSLIAVAPEILDFLRDNQEWRLYYILWQYVAEDYVGSMSLMKPQRRYWRCRKMPSHVTTRLDWP